MSEDRREIGETAERLAEAVLGGRPQFTATELWERAGAEEELARTLWRAMGFPEMPDDAIAFTDADADALRLVSDQVKGAVVPPDVAIRFTRMLGQSMSRIADAILTIGEGPEVDVDGFDHVELDDLTTMMGEVIMPLVEQELVYLFRRHLFAGAIRRIGAAEAAGELTVIGFADVVSFTRLSGQLREADLAELLERFERSTADEITDHGGRVVKLIGDAVLFAFDDPVAAAECALHLVERFGGDDPDLRVGLAYGDVIARLGDVFGPTVNRASRLVGYARPGTVLVDGDLAAELVDVAQLRVSSLRTRLVKGLGMTQMHRVQWAPDGDQDTTPMSASMPARISSARAARRRRLVSE